MRAQMLAGMLTAATLLGPVALSAQTIDRFVLVLGGRGGAIAVEIGEDRIFHITHVTHGHRGPLLLRPRRPRVHVDPHRAAFLPAGRDIRQTVAIDVGQADAVGPPARIIDHVTRPGILRHT